MRNDEIAIIGGGPAGIATAIQLRRYGLRITVLEKNRIGGLLSSANLVENYPGFPLGISGSNIARLFEEQLRNSGANILFEEVVSLCSEEGRFVVTTNERALYPAIVVVASGTRPIELSNLVLPTEFQEAVCYDISSIIHERGKRIVIVGAGDAAFDYALNLGANNEVVIVNRGNGIGCLPLLLQRAGAMENISYFDNTEVIRIVNLRSNEVCVECMRQGELLRFQAHFLIPAIGREPQLGFLPTDRMGNLDRLTTGGNIHFVGDVKNGNFRQTAIAVGDGIKTAMKIGAKLTIRNREEVIGE